MTSLKKLDNFLQREIPNAQVPKAIGIVLLVKYSWLLILLPIMAVIMFFYDGMLERNTFLKDLKPEDLPLLVILFMAFIEEVKFRLPLSVFVWLKLPTWGIMLVAILLSVLFGLLHGNGYNIPLQGFGGLLYSILYLKCGGMQKKPGKAIIVTTLAHALHNTLMYFL